MELYFSPMACSLATRIALYEAAAEARFVQVDTRRKRLVDGTPDGADFWPIAPMGQVPVLRTDDGELIAENAAVLQYVGERFPHARLIPDDAMGRTRLRQWIAFIGAELHKAVFIPLLDRDAPPEAKEYARGKAALRLNVLEAHLQGRVHLLDAFSVADAYLTAVLNWAPFADVDLAPWPAIQRYHRRMTARPAVARAIGEEFELWKAEQARRKAA